MKTCQSGVYQIKNRLNGKVYVGSAAYFAQRKATHLTHLRRGSHRNTKLQNAFKKYGESAFEFSVLIRCAKNDAVFYEQRVIDAFDAVASGYNILPVAGSALGFKHSSEHRASMGGNTLALGYRHTEETKARISESIKGNKYSLGVKKPDSARKAVSDALKGRKQSPEHVRKRIEAVTIAKRLKKQQKESEKIAGQ